MDAQRRLAVDDLHLYDYYLRPGGAYFGAKKALEPVHVQYSYDDRSIVVVNGRHEKLAGLKVTARLYDLDMKQRFSRQTALDVPADGVARAFVLPEAPDLSSVHFLKLRLEDSGHELVSSNFYWLSTRPDELDWDASTWFYTPARSYADFTGLTRLPPVELRVAVRHETTGEEGRTRVRLENPTESLAFAVRLQLTRGEGGREVLPILWQDNYFELLPGASREIEARYRFDDLQGAEPVVSVDGWNVSAAAE